MQLIERLRAILASDKLLLEEIRKELVELKERFGDKRRTEIIPETHEISIEDMIADEDMVITVTSSGYIKRSPLSLYRAQGRGGKGRTGMTTKDDDFVEHLFVASAHSYVLVFTESGRVYWIKVHEIPQAGPAAKGKAIVNLLNLEGDETRSPPPSRCATSPRTASWSSPPRRARSRRRRSPSTATRAPAASSPSTSTRATGCSRSRSPTAPRTSSSPPPTACRSASRSPTAGRWGGRRPACAASRCARATGWSAWRCSRRRAPS